jgi:hypothetical protein
VPALPDTRTYGHDATDCPDFPRPTRADTWYQSHDGVTYHTNDNSMLVAGTTATSGTDSGGVYTGVHTTYTIDGGTPAAFETSVRVCKYPHPLLSSCTQ